MKKLLLFLLLIPSFVSAQKIGLEAMFHNDGTFQAGIAVTEAVQCFGAYVNAISHENSQDDLTLCDTVINITGLTTGIIYSVNYDRLKTLSIGVGRIITENIDKYNQKTGYCRTVKFIVEAKAGIHISRSIEVITGITTQPAIMAGVRVNIN